MKKQLTTFALAAVLSFDALPVKAEGDLYSCDTLETQELSENGKLQKIDASQQIFGRVGTTTFDEASGVMRDSIGTYNMEVIQKGTSEVSLVAIDIYRGSGEDGADVFRIDTWKKNMPFFYLRTSEVYTGTCKRMN